MRCACIDIGSNTTRLLVAEPDEGRLREVLIQRVFTRIGAARSKDEAIDAAKIAEVTDVVASQVRMARECEAQRIRIVATAAVRTAPNRGNLTDAIHAATGVGVDILTGEDEARLAFLGATRTLAHLPIGEVGVVDVGGGSSELVCGTLVDGVSWFASFRVGSAYLTEHYVRSDPPSAAELSNVRSHVAGVFEGLEAPCPRTAYAVGGSATSLRRLVGAELTHEALDHGLQLLSRTPIEEVARRFELHTERVRVLPAGMLLLLEAGDAFGVPLRIGSGGIREGVVLEELARVAPDGIGMEH